ncbi:NUDIX domain-containing protein [Naasia lichenicola]|uniref:NUDIX domain-containing protein n=1 Tax=Naasia lichenicola TaxID=2565933 RepID=A0A4V3WTW9_9MICO|nr:NUDIX domain-containing protein [Naasia lichenicola]
MHPVQSAGVLVFRRSAAGSIEVLIGHMGGPFWARKDEHAWSIPKGLIEHDETPYDAAAREFTEELGLGVPAGIRHDLGTVRQRGGKTVQVWAVEGDPDLTDVVLGEFELEWPPRSGRTASFPEVDRVAWFLLEDARDKLVSAQAEFLDRLAALNP